MNGKSSSASWGGICFLSFLLAGAVAFVLLVWHISDQRPEDGEPDGAVVVQPAEEAPPGPADTQRYDEPVDDGQGEAWHLATDQRPPDQAPDASGASGTEGWADVTDSGDGQDDSEQLPLQLDLPDPAVQTDQPADPLVELVAPTGIVPAYSSAGRETVEPVLGMGGYVTEHYVIYSQLSDETAYDVARRLEAMYDYYAERFGDVYYPIDFTKQVFLFNNRDDFVAAGGHPFMPGQVMSGHDETGLGARLMVIFHESNIGAFMSSCPLMYHEGFHQFVAIEISQGGNVNRQWPLWLDEGYATTFNNITWTGDGWVDGNIRLEYADSATKSAGSFIPLRKLLDISGENWHELTNEGGIWAIYMEGMSLVYFLNHAEDGKYRSLLADYVEQVSTGQDSSGSGRRIIALQSKFERWFKKNMNTHVTAAKYYEILTAMATSHLARAHARGQRFASGEDFLAKARANKLDLPPMGDPEWLPDSLREELLYYHTNLTESNQAFEFDINYPGGGGTPVLRVYQPRFGLELEGAFELDRSGKVVSVAVEYIQCPSINLVEAKRIVGTTD